MSVIHITHVLGIVVACVLVTLAVLAPLLPAAAKRRLKAQRRRLRLRLRQLRYHRRKAAARRREAALERRARAGRPQAQWDSDDLRRLVMDAFDPVQRRWRPHDARQSRTYLSDALYDRHRRELEQLEARHQTRRIVVSSLDDVEIVGLDSATHSDVTRVVAQVRFRAYETLLDSRSARVIDGVPRKRRALREDWTLAWHPTRGWLIDDIQRRRTRSGWGITGFARFSLLERLHGRPPRTRGGGDELRALDSGAASPRSQPAR